MDRDYGRELDELREELSDMRHMLEEFLRDGPGGRRPAGPPHPGGPGEGIPPHERPEGPHWGPEPPGPGPHGRFPGRHEPRWVGNVAKMSHMHPNPHVMALLDSLENKVGRKGMTGAITYIGVYASGGRQSTWIRKEINIDGLLRLIEDRSAERVLACIGNNDRLNLLLALLRRPMTVAQLVTECGYNSTGQVYHHLRPLIAANLVMEDEHDDGKGRYVVVSHRVQGIIMLLAGISDMLDPQYTQGDWTADEDADFDAVPENSDDTENPAPEET